MSRPIHPSKALLDSFKAVSYLHPTQSTRPCLFLAHSSITDALGCCGSVVPPALSLHSTGLTWRRWHIVSNTSTMLGRWYGGMACLKSVIGCFGSCGGSFPGGSRLARQRPSPADSLHEQMVFMALARDRSYASLRVLISCAPQESGLWRCLVHGRCEGAGGRAAWGSPCMSAARLCGGTEASRHRLAGHT